jgi:hypothetical protein
LAAGWREPDGESATRFPFVAAHAAA